jgi:hypothetical protein
VRHTTITTTTEPMARHRLHVWPWLRIVGRLMLKDWLAITIGRDIYAWRTLGVVELAHELAHVDQWRRHGAWFAVRYLLASLGARRAGGRWYHDNPYEVEARAAASAAERRQTVKKPPAT